MKQNKDREQLTTRVLLTLVSDLAEAEETAHAIHVKIAALAKEHGVRMVRP